MVPTLHQDGDNYGISVMWERAPVVSEPFYWGKTYHSGYIKRQSNRDEIDFGLIREFPDWYFPTEEDKFINTPTAYSIWYHSIILSKRRYQPVISGDMIPQINGDIVTFSEVFETNTVGPMAYSEITNNSSFYIHSTLKPIIDVEKIILNGMTYYRCTMGDVYLTLTNGN